MCLVSATSTFPASMISCSVTNILVDLLEIFAIGSSAILLKLVKYVDWRGVYTNCLLGMAVSARELGRFLLEVKILNVCWFLTKGNLLGKRKLSSEDGNQPRLEFILSVNRLRFVGLPCGR